MPPVAHRRVVRKVPVPPEPVERVTLALVYRTVDDLKALTEAHFETVKATLTPLTDVPSRIAALETRVTVLEDDDADRRDRFGRFIATAALLVSIAALVVGAIVPILS